MAKKASGVSGAVVPALYDVHPAVTMVREWAEGLGQKTGRSLEEWVGFSKSDGPTDTTELRDWLMKQHGFGRNAAGWIVDRVEGKGWGDGDPAVYLASASGYVDALYSGKKAALRGIHNALIVEVRALGADIRICPATTIVPIYRRHVIAQLKPGSNTRVDLGLALGNLPAEGRLIDTGGYAKKDRITHRIAVGSVAEIDDEVRSWMRAAYAQDEDAGV